ncbi:HIRAN domain-containing protein [Anaerolentibacter hominis]|uniref:HIRAN domain-containing protein n=1 Tax=Anaerolentibacter hominis TaxID=3079009 RepID=UPI0031B89233
MTINEGKDFLYLIWKCDKTRRQYIIGRLSKNGQYEFQYYGEIKEAQEAGFTPLISFEDLDRVYKSNELFPVFSSRLPDRKRKDIDNILKKYDLEEYDVYQLLKRSGAKLPIDNLYFIDPILNLDSGFEKVFYLAGVRHYLGCEGDDCSNAINVTRGDEVFLNRELDNPFDENAIRVTNETEDLLGYIPRYYSLAFIHMIEEGKKFSCHIANVDRSKGCDECISIAIKTV